MTLSDDELQTLTRAMYAFAYNTVDSKRAEMLESRLRQIAVMRGHQGIGPLVDALRRPNTPEALEIIEALVNHETSFFRDPRFFDALRDHVLPMLIERRRPLRRLRILSAGCATGQEAYSVAMLLRESFPVLATWQVDIVGVDVAPKCLERAKLGVYSRFEVERGLPETMQRRYFQPEGDELRVVGALRALTRFSRQNLALPWTGLFGFDVVLLRNVLMYLDEPVKGSVLRQARHALHANGMLLLGAAETLDSTKHPFQRTALNAYSVYLPQ